MITIFGYDIFNYITLFLHNYKDILALRYINKDTYLHEFENTEIEASFNTKIDLPKLEKMIAHNMTLFKIPNIKVCILIDCTLTDILTINTVNALHIRDCYTYCNPLIFTQYDSLVAVYLYNFLIDPDDLVLPNLEYLFIYESDYDDSYVYIFNIERFPNLKYLDLCKIYMDNDSTCVPLLEYYNGFFQNYQMPNLKYLEWTNELLPESYYLQQFPNLIAIITYYEPIEPFNRIQILRPEISDIAQKYYNNYFLLK